MSLNTKLCGGAAILAALAFASTVQSQEFDFSSVEKMKSSVISAQEGMTDEEKTDFGQALMRLLLATHPLTKDLETFPAMMVLGSQGDAFYTSSGGVFDSITSEAVQAEIASFKADEATTAQATGAKTAEADGLLTCLQSKVNWSNARFENKDGSWFKVDVTNDLSWAIRGYHVAYTIKGDGRSVPVKEDKSSGEISGGIEPQETRTISVWAGANISPYQVTTIDVSLINLFDAEDRRLVDNNINYIGRSPDISPRTCD